MSILGASIAVLGMAISGYGAEVATGADLGDVRTVHRGVVISRIGVAISVVGLVLAAAGLVYGIVT